MKSKSIHSKAFRVDNPKSKSEQEKYVCEEFIQAYLKETGLLLIDNGAVVQDPPDRLFLWDKLTIGAELFELDQMYDTRALIDTLTNEIYAEIERRKITDNYLGTAIFFGSIASISTGNEVRSKWVKMGIKKKAVKLFAREFVDFIQAKFHLEKLSSQNLLRAKVDSDEYPALAAFGKIIAISSTVKEDPRRSDGKASPSVVLSGATSVDTFKLTQSIVNKISEKINGRSRWMKVDHTILIAHDLPREHYYQGFEQPWEELLKIISQHPNIIDAFDEFWLITHQRMFDGEGIRIFGTTLDKIHKNN